MTPNLLKVDTANPAEFMCTSRACHMIATVALLDPGFTFGTSLCGVLDFFKGSSLLLLGCSPRLAVVVLSAALALVPADFMMNASVDAACTTGKDRITAVVDLATGTVRFWTLVEVAHHVESSLG
jgi:hypothetical protein